MKLQYEIIVEGRVQGVGYRFFVKSKAQELNLTGYTRNSPGGEVLVVAEGDKKDLDTLVDYLQIGSHLARIRNIAVSKSPFTGVFEDFVIIY